MSVQIFQKSEKKRRPKPSSNWLYDRLLHEFNDCHRSSITATDACFNNTCVSAGTIRISGSDFVEQFLQSSSAFVINFNVANKRSCLTASVKISTFSESDETIHH